MMCNQRGGGGGVGEGERERESINMNVVILVEPETNVLYLHVLVHRRAQDKVSKRFINS